eukprot:m.1639234 g.1639234  ORF g.1639234 m.1639234 type:complete len:609 (+) comp34005_c0_seq1:263-2089(+)
MASSSNTVPIWEQTTPVSSPSPRPSTASTTSGAVGSSSPQTSKTTEYDAVIAMSEQRGEYEATPDDVAHDSSEKFAETGDDEAMAAAIMHQDSDALDILRQLPTRDDWHGDIGMGSPYARFREQRSAAEDTGSHPATPLRDSATSSIPTSGPSPTSIPAKHVTAGSGRTQESSGSPALSHNTHTGPMARAAVRPSDGDGGDASTSSLRPAGDTPAPAPVPKVHPESQPRLSKYLDVTSSALTPQAPRPAPNDISPGTSAFHRPVARGDHGATPATSTGRENPAPTTPQRRPPALDVQSPMSAHDPPPNAALVCARQGTAHLRNGELALARKCFERGLGAHPSNNVKMVLLSRLGEVCRVMRDFDSAVQYATQHVGLATAFKATKEIYRAQRTKGMSNLAWALQLLESLENDGDELADQERPAAMLNDALLSFQDIVHKATAMNDYLVVARAHRDIMKVHQVLGNDAQALEAAEKHLALIRGRGTKNDIGRAVCSCAALRAVNGVNGDITWTKRDFEGVLELLWEQAAIGEELQDLELIGNAYYQISKLMEDAGSWADWYGPAKARQFLQKAIAAFGGIEHPNARQVTQREDCEQRLEALNTEGSCSIQ